MAARSSQQPLRAEDGGGDADGDVPGQREGGAPGHGAPQVMFVGIGHRADRLTVERLEADRQRAARFVGAAQAAGLARRGVGNVAARPGGRLVLSGAVVFDGVEAFDNLSGLMARQAASPDRMTL